MSSQWFSDFSFLFVFFWCFLWAFCDLTYNFPSSSFFFLLLLTGWSHKGQEHGRVLPLILLTSLAFGNHSYLKHSDHGCQCIRTSEFAIMKDCLKEVRHELSFPSVKTLFNTVSHLNSLPVCDLLMILVYCSHIVFMLGFIIIFLLF